MNRAFLILVGVGIGVFLVMKFTRHPASNTPARVTLENKGADNTPLRKAMIGMQNNVDQGMEAMKQIETLHSLLAAKNDNDSKYDTEMRNLSPETKDTMMSDYRSTARESRNNRGTIAFLIGREINRSEDLKFMEEVLNEPPCLSLVNCASEVKEDAHVDGATGAETTLVYPQIVSVRALGEFAKSTTDESLKTSARILLERASRSHPSERVQSESAQALATSFKAQ